MRKREGTYHDELYDKMWKTKGARFNAYERLRRKHQLSTYATSFVSAYLIVINLLTPFNFHTDLGIEPNTISFITVALSVVLLAFVILENTAEYNLKGDAFHNCSKEIGRLFNRLHSLIEQTNPDEDEIERIANDYADILDKYDNHSPIDYAVHKTKHKNDFDLNLIQREWIKFNANYLVHSHYILMIIGPPICVIIWWFNK
ncbi:SLATT domain-containing protein [Flavobacteriaceae bacterium 144Ye]|nr:SLATT domain-containing protein [Flavobacteriaceae bacterium 144Ye]